MQRRILLFFTVLSLLAGAIACGIPRSSNAVQGTPQPVEKHLSAFQPIAGTEYMIANISASPTTAERDFSPFSWMERGYSGYSGYDIYNYVFFSSQTETFNRLLPTNEYIVLQIVGFPSGASGATLEELEPVQWWLYIVAKEDTDKNGLLNYDDKLTVGVTDVGGDHPVELIADVDNVLGHTLQGDSLLFVIYHSLNKNYVAKIDLPGRQIISTNEISLGDDVK